MLDIAKWLWGPSLILTKRKLYIEINIGNRENLLFNNLYIVKILFVFYLMGRNKSTSRETA